MTMASLDSLPLDVHFIILSYASSTTAYGPDHAFLMLAQTCKSLQQVVDSYCTHELHKLHAQRPAHSPKPPFCKGATRRLVRFRSKHCEFCGIKTSETAKLYKELRCCRVCEKEQWPDKVTMTFATKNYNIPKDQLMANVHYGQYMCYNVLTTIFLHSDVKRYAETIHGPLSAFLERKQRRRAARRAAAAERLRLRREELCELLVLNNIDPATCYEDLKWEIEYSTPVLVVRRHILESRIAAEGHINARVQALRSEGYGPLIGNIDPYQERLPTASSPNAPRQRFPVDEALADMFLSEFGPTFSASTLPPPTPGQMPPDIYRLRHSPTSFNPLFAATARDFRIQPHAPCPWEFNAYPVLVKEVCVAPVAKSEAWVRKRRQATESRNQRLVGEFETLRGLYRRIIEKGEWAGPVRSVGGVGGVGGCPAMNGGAGMMGGGGALVGQGGQVGAFRSS